jgi:hypothetical protein
VPVPYVDVLCGGFPCQDISIAGKGAGITGARSGLWFEFARLIREIRPRYVIVENVPALLRRGLWQVLADLSACGYDAEWDCIRLKPLAPLTGATASGSSRIPTPTAGDAKSSGSRNLPGSGAALGVSLTDYVRPDRLERFKWPTPHGMPKDGQARNPGPSGNELGRAVNLAETWPTPTAQDAANDGGPAQLNRNSLPLNAAVKAETPPAETEEAESPQQRLWPTPRPGSSGGHGGGSEFGTYRRTPSQKAGKHGLYLQAEVIEEEIARAG